ncbi:MAG TPA: ATP-binding protein, partial [Mycobacteriales bacterium]|nr:ATP-binding protein [Mycobacteriales bacterium]
LLLLAGGVGGYVARLAVAAEARLAEAVRLAAATRERERLARGIHDGVLQVLALVRRRGTELGGPAAELAALAGEQETALRTLITTPPPTPQPHAPGTEPRPGRMRPRTGGTASRPGGTGPRVGATGTGAAGRGLRAGGTGPRAGRRVGERRWSGTAGRPEPVPEVDVRSLLGRLRAEAVTVSGPAEPVPLPEHAAAELAAAVAAALDNVAVHAGSRSWVLVEDLGGEVAVSVRDEGPGIPPGRLAQAEADGRLGVASSMRGRITDLGGTMSVHTVPGEGTEVEFRVPRGAH